METGGDPRPWIQGAWTRSRTVPSRSHLGVQIGWPSLRADPKGQGELLGPIGGTEIDGRPSRAASLRARAEQTAAHVRLADLARRHGLQQFPGVPGGPSGFGIIILGGRHHHAAYLSQQPA